MSASSSLLICGWNTTLEGCFSLAGLLVCVIRCRVALSIFEDVALYVEMGQGFEFLLKMHGLDLRYLSPRTPEARGLMPYLCMKRLHACMGS